jgi:hypothetical protein
VPVRRVQHDHQFARIRGVGSVIAALVAAAQGLQSIRRALSIAEQLPAPENAEYLADAYGAMGLAYSRRAARPNRSSSARIAVWEQAREAYQKSLNNWLAEKRRGTLTLFNAREPDRIAAELTKCDAALATLTPRTR